MLKIIKQNKNPPTWKHVKQQKINKATKNMLGESQVILCRARAQQCTPPPDAGFALFSPLSVGSHTAGVKLARQTGFCSAHCLESMGVGCWWSIYSDTSLWLSEVAPFHSDIRHWLKVLPLPSRKPFGPSQCPKQFTSPSAVSPLIRQQVKEMCPNWTSRWTLQYQPQDFPLSDLPLCKDSEVTPGQPLPSFTLFRRITSNMGNAKSQFPSVREEFPDGTALFT